MAIDTYKVCSICGLDLPLDDYYKNPNYKIYGAKDGLQPYCKECDDERQLERYESNKPAELQRNKEWRESTGRGHLNDYQRNWRKQRKTKQAQEGHQEPS